MNRNCLTYDSEWMSWAISHVVSLNWMLLVQKRNCESKRGFDEGKLNFLPSRRNLPISPESSSSYEKFRNLFSSNINFKIRKIVFSMFQAFATSCFIIKLLGCTALGELSIICLHSAPPKRPWNNIEIIENEFVVHGNVSQPFQLIRNFPWKYFFSSLQRPRR